MHQDGQNSRFFIFKVYRYIYFRQINIKLWFSTRCKMTIDLLMARTIAKYFAMLVKKKRYSICKIPKIKVEAKPRLLNNAFLIGRIRVKQLLQGKSLTRSLSWSILVFLCIYMRLALVNIGMNYK